MTAPPLARAWLDRVLRPGRCELLLPALAALLVSAPLLLDLGAILGPDTYRSYDWLETAKLDAYSRLSLLQWGTVPFWNPLLQGGFPQLSHPSDGSLSPLILPTLLLGEAAGMKLNVIIALLLGSIGTALLGRDRLELSPRYAAFAGCAFAVVGWIPSRVAIGYYESALYAAFPLLLWLFLQSAGRPWRLLGATALLALGAMHVHLGLPVLMLVLLLVTLAEVARRSLAPWHLWRLLLLCLGAAAMAAVKLAPMLTYVYQLGLRRQTEYSSFDAFYGGPTDLLSKLIFAAPELGRYDAAGSVSFGDFGYVGLGLPLLLLALVGLALCWRLPPGQRIYAGLAVLFVWLCFGDRAPIDLFRALWSLPLFHSMRGALRYFTFGLALFGCLLAAGALQWLVGRLRRPSLRAPLALGLALACLAWPAFQSAARYHSAFTRPASLTARPARFVQERVVGTRYTRHLGGDPSHDRGNTLLYTNLKAGIGTIYVPEDLPARSEMRGKRVYNITTRRYKPDPGYRGEVFCFKHDCQAELLEVSPNRVRLRANLKHPDFLLVNQQMSPQWMLISRRARHFDPPEEVHQILGARFNATGPVEVLFEYQPPAAFWFGLALSFTALLGGLAWTLVQQRQRHHRRHRRGRPGARG